LNGKDIPSNLLRAIKKAKREIYMNIEIPQDIIKIANPFRITYTHAIGRWAGKFFIELRDNRKIMGIRCSRCNRVYVPPRALCGTCFSPMEQLVELSNEGSLITYTRVHYTEPVHPVPSPFFYGIILLDGADTGLVHLIGEVDPDKIRKGIRVEAKFREERKGNILDIRYFKPL